MLTPDELRKIRAALLYGLDAINLLEDDAYDLDDLGTGNNYTHQKADTQDALDLIDRELAKE